MEKIYKLCLTANATSWMVVIYAIDKRWTYGKIAPLLFGLGLLVLPVVFSVVSIMVADLLSGDELGDCQEFSLADNEFLPTYLGYFFLAVGISEKCSMWIIYFIVFVFTYLSQMQYFNPIFLLFGYHYYHVLTPSGTKLLVIARGKVIRNKNDFIIKNLRRINDMTYIERR